MAKTGHWILLIACVTSLLVGPSRGAVVADYENLMTTLFTSYNKGVRPRIDDTLPTYVDMGLSLLSIQQLDEINQHLAFTCYLEIEWTDSRLSWVALMHNGIYEFTYPQTHVWLPDITLGNTIDTLGELGFSRNPVYVRSTGYVYWTPGGVFRTSCEIDVTYYPFDTQSCTVEFTTRISQSTMMKLSFRPDAVRTDSYSPSGTWDLVSLDSTTRPDFSNFSVVGFTMTLKRLQTYYVVAIIAPVTFLSFTATLVFALPADSGEKMGTSITVLLAFAVYLTIVAEQMPKTSSNVSLLSIWLTMLLGMTALGVVLTVWILNLHYRDDEHPPGKIMCGIALFLRRLMFKEPWRKKVSPTDDATKVIKLEDIAAGKRKNEDDFDDRAWKRPKSDDSVATGDQGGNNKSSDGPKMTWQTLAWTFDRFFFFFFTVIVITSSAAFFVIMLTY